MFKRFKKEKISLMSVGEGKVIDISDVKDEVFSQKMLGEGFAIEVEGDTFYAPIDATVSMVFPSMHAVGLKGSDGFEVLIHIGIDTVNENGEGFTSFVEMNDEVKKGEKLVTINREALLKKGYDLTTVIVFTNPDAYSSFEVEVGKKVVLNDVVASYIK
ncbi:PTS system glucose-specific IIA component [Breznakia sp. PF5-3]|uniref:PTS sugar transporter subunit IIA n=1 Tax=unclassified Breznakia TaxID=2623764 RepID=UPI0024049B49|nr:MULTISPECIES: PTS glucose transporter subunit IIA [unclassified Breznakia]MDF9825483.1 PTS system glucose-specific IIA component [Breznakia sp. PM6-1]MDF9836329.1 PTS system glucose-specific IIA component [Breznakia sp. PF5-3]MDL2276777.1 PTS glucose transporter subunit IIA [Breznakia sp. OttesenSCG-928-G09]